MIDCRVSEWALLPRFYTFWIRLVKWVLGTKGDVGFGLVVTIEDFCRGGVEDLVKEMGECSEIDICT